MDDRDTRAATYSGGIALLVIALLAIGAVMAASTSTNLDQPLVQRNLWQTPFGRHLLLIALSVLVLLGSARVTLWWLRAGTRARLGSALLLSLVTVAVLAAVWLPGIGVDHHGARRWIRLGTDAMGLSFQPSELAKPALILALAAVLGHSAQGARTLLRGFVPAAAIVAVFVVLIGVEDFGTAVLLAAVGGLTLLAGGCRVWHCVAAAVPGSATLGYLLVSEPYRVRRLTVFLDVFADPQGAGYHPIQSLAAIVSGGWFGLGVGNGLQKHGFLPEARSDFVFSVICEETGVFGGVGVILLYAALAYLGLRVMRLAATRTAQLIAFAATMVITLQASLNIAVATVSAPTKGIPLPMISAGGTGMVCLCACAGMVLAVARYGERTPAHAAVSIEPLSTMRRSASGWQTSAPGVST